jgi:hypothetical protein
MTLKNQVAKMEREFGNGAISAAWLSHIDGLIELGADPDEVEDMRRFAATQTEPPLSHEEALDLLSDEAV